MKDYVMISQACHHTKHFHGPCVVLKLQKDTRSWSVVAQKGKFGAIKKFLENLEGESLARRGERGEKKWCFDQDHAPFRISADADWTVNFPDPKTMAGGIEERQKKSAQKKARESSMKKNMHGGKKTTKKSGREGKEKEGEEEEEDEEEG